MVKDSQTGTVLGEYWYDAMGRRIKKLVNGVATIYVYTYNWRAIEEYENGSLARSYAYGQWIDDVLTMDRTVEGDRLYYHANALESVIALTDSNGLPVEGYSYDAYGQPLFFDSSGISVAESTIGNPYLFTGRRFDLESGWYYYRSRYLDPVAGRFTTRDSMTIWYDMLNLGNGYAYVHNAPFSWVDPTGSEAEECFECRLKVTYSGWDWLSYKYKAKLFYGAQELTDVPKEIDKGLFQSLKVSKIELQAKVTTEEEPCCCEALVAGRMSQLTAMADVSKMSFNKSRAAKIAILAVVGGGLAEFVNTQTIASGLFSKFGGAYGTSALIHAIVLGGTEFKIKETELTKTTTSKLDCDWAIIGTVFDLGRVTTTQAVKGEVLVGGQPVCTVLRHFR